MRSDLKKDGKYKQVFLQMALTENTELQYGPSDPNKSDVLLCYNSIHRLKITFQLKAEKQRQIQLN